METELQKRTSLSCRFEPNYPTQPNPTKPTLQRRHALPVPNSTTICDAKIED